jgi:hypothetical protein
MIQKILSARTYNTLPYMQIVYEWEDEIGKILNLSIESSKFLRPFNEKLIYNRITKKLISEEKLVNLLQVLNKTIEFSQNALCFEIYPQSSFINNRSTKSSAIPVILDFWKYENLDNFYNVYKNCKLIYISSLEVLNYLNENQIPLNLKHFPISLPSKYKGLTNGNSERPFDIVVIGRQNNILMDYLIEYSSKYKDVTYISQIFLENKIFYKCNNGKLIGPVESRSDYFDLIKLGKVSFYSTPGMDDGAKRTGGFNPVTPRFLELLSANCLLMGRFPDTDETRFFELSKVCPNINTYENFESVLNGHLNKNMKNFDFSNQQKLLSKHYTSQRLSQLLNNS